MLCLTWEEEDKGGLWVRAGAEIPSFEEEKKLKSLWRYLIGDSSLPAPGWDDVFLVFEVSGCAAGL